MAHVFRPLIRGRLAGLCGAMLLGCLTTLSLAASEPNKRSIWFRVFSDTPIADLEYESGTMGQRTPLTFFPTALSPRYETTADGSVRFFVRGENKLMAEAVIPSDLDEALLLLSIRPDRPKSARSYLVQVYDNTVARRPAGTWTVLNATGLALSGKLGSTPIALNPGLNPPRKLSPSMRLELRTPFNGKSYRAMSELIELKAGERGWLLLLPPFRAGSLEVQSRWLIDALEPANAGAQGR